MKIALIIAYILIAILAIVAFMQWRAISALTPAKENSDGSSNREGSGTFGDMVKAIQDKLDPKEFTVKF